MKHTLLASVALLAVAGSLFGATAAQAGITFDYTGQPFAMGIVSGSWGPLQDTSVYGTYLSGSITFDDTVTRNFTGTVNILSDVTDWVFTSGPITQSSSNNDGLSGSVTFTNGAITAWGIVAKDWHGSPVDGTTLVTLYNSQYSEDWAIVLSAGIQNGNANYSPISSNGVGTWTVASSTAVPEPASLALLASSLFGLGLIRRRRA